MSRAISALFIITVTVVAAANIQHASASDLRSQYEKAKTYTPIVDGTHASVAWCIGYLWTNSGKAFARERGEDPNQRSSNSLLTLADKRDPNGHINSLIEKFGQFDELDSNPINQTTEDNQSITSGKSAFESDCNKIVSNPLNCRIRLSECELALRNFGNF